MQASAKSKVIDRCKVCNRWRPFPYIRGQWISPEVLPPSKDDKPLPERWVTCDDCKEGKHATGTTRKKSNSESLRVVQGVEKDQ
jgi:hypothetical protein